MSGGVTCVHEGIRVTAGRPLPRHLTSNHVMQHHLTHLREQVEYFFFF